MNPILAGVIAGVIVGECGPWTALLAVKLVRWSARLRYLDEARGEVRAEELAAYVRDMPGNLFKLVTALWFVAGASAAWAHRARHRLRRWPAALGRLTVQGRVRVRAGLSARSAVRIAVGVGGGGLLLQLVIDLFQAPEALVSLIKMFNGTLLGVGALVALWHASGGQRVGSWVRQYRARSGRRR